MKTNVVADYCQIRVMYTKLLVQATHILPGYIKFFQSTLKKSRYYNLKFLSISHHFETYYNIVSTFR